MVGLGVGIGVGSPKGEFFEAMPEGDFVAEFNDAGTGQISILAYTPDEDPKGTGFTVASTPSQPIFDKDLDAAIGVASETRGANFCINGFDNLIEVNATIDVKALTIGDGMTVLVASDAFGTNLFVVEALVINATDLRVRIFDQTGTIASDTISTGVVGTHTIRGIYDNGNCSIKLDARTAQTGSHTNAGVCWGRGTLTLVGADVEVDRFDCLTALTP